MSLLIFLFCGLSLAAEDVNGCNPNESMKLSPATKSSKISSLLRLLKGEFRNLPKFFLLFILSNSILIILKNLHVSAKLLLSTLQRLAWSSSKFYKNLVILSSHWISRQLHHILERLWVKIHLRPPYTHASKYNLVMYVMYVACRQHIA